MKILYIPLDERPCNYKYPAYLADTRDDVELLIPPKELLGNKKAAANVEKLWEFVFSNASRADGFVLSSEMLIYGGLLPSRLHHLSTKVKDARLDHFRRLHKMAEQAPIYVSCLIMRAPKYDSSDEEPDYYALYGSMLFQRAYLKDKQLRTGNITTQEEQEIKKLDAELPASYIKDYESRRAFNVHVNLQLLDLVEEGTISFLSIPQDDSSVFGYTAQDQRTVYNQITAKRLQKKIMVYPGADEAGSTLLARMTNRLLDRKPAVYYFYSATLGPTLIPLYEDRPINESVKAHLLAAGCYAVQTPEAADFALAINTPGKLMEEASIQPKQDISYSSFRQLRFFVEEIQELIQSDVPVAIADCAFANGGDQELIQYLDDCHILDALHSYKGWNTSCNTLGTSIAAGVFSFDSQNDLEIKRNLLYHLFDDVFYQSRIRTSVTEKQLPALGGNYFDLNDKDAVVEGEIRAQLLSAFNTCIINSFRDISISTLKVICPWSRMFEIGLDIEISQK